MKKMIKLSPHVLEELKKPLGELIVNSENILDKIADKRIISIGDICTINLIKSRIKPHLAVFDLKSQRKELTKELKDIIEASYPKPKRYDNTPGTISEKLLSDAKALLKEGGGILIEGEEDICALAFIKEATSKDVIIYGQPKEGIVLIKPTKEIKEKIEKWILSSRAFSHKV